MLPLLLAMDADTVLACGRASSRLLRLVRDREVWRHLLRDTDDLTKEKLEELVGFGSSQIPEMMAEVLKETARRMSRLVNDPVKMRVGYLKMMLSIQGWGSPGVYAVYLYGDHLKKLLQVATAVGSSFTILEVEHKVGLRNPLLKQIAAHVKRQGKALDKLDFGYLDSHDMGIDGYGNVFLEMLQMSKWWRVKELQMTTNIDNSWATLANNASTGRIDICHAPAPRGFKDAKRRDVRKVWEISSVMRIFVQWEVISVGKDQPGDPEANWHKLVELAGL